MTILSRFEFRVFVLGEIKKLGFQQCNIQIYTSEHPKIRWISFKDKQIKGRYDGEEEYELITIPEELEKWLHKYD